MVQHGLFGVMPRVEWAQQRYDETITDATRQQRKKLFMRNIPNDVTEEQVRHLVEQYGPVEHVTLRDDTQPSRAVTPPCSATPHPSLEPPDRLCGVRERGVRGDRVRQAVPDVPLPELRLDPDNDEAGGDQEGACGAARPPPRGANRGAAGGNRRNGQRPSATCSGASSLTDYRGGALGSDGMPDMDGICTHAHRKQLCSSEFDTASFQSSQSAFYEYNMSSTASVGTQEENFGHRSGPMALGYEAPCCQRGPAPYEQQPQQPYDGMPYSDQWGSASCRRQSAFNSSMHSEGSRKSTESGVYRHNPYSFL
eukprot:gene749-biopygen586